MDIRIEEKNGISILRMAGDIDINTAPALKDSLESVIRNKNILILINLSGVDYIDSSGLATLVEILKSLNKQGGKLKLTNLSVKVKGLFEITKLTQLFDILDKEDEAINSFDKQK